MCKICTTYKVKSKLSVYQREQQYDPTRTLTLRNRFASDLKKRFREIRGLIRKAVVDQDVLGLAIQSNELLVDTRPYVGGLVVNQVPARQAFNFPRSGDKVSSFMGWLRGQVDNKMLEIRHIPQLGTPIEGAWTNMYVQDSYKRGVLRASYEMRKAGYTLPGIQERGGIDAIMSTPFHMDRVGVLYTRVFEELKGITNAMDTQISRVLSEGMINGDGPALLARKMNAVISGKDLGSLGITDSLGRFIPAERRAAMMARTEIIRAHHTANINEYESWGVEGVEVEAEFITAEDDRVCAQCEALAVGSPYTLEQIRGMIPAHPSCRCVAVPVPASGSPTQKAAETIEEAPLIRTPIPEDPIPYQFRKGGSWAGDSVEFDPEFFRMVKRRGRKQPSLAKSKTKKLPRVMDSDKGAFYDRGQHTVYLSKGQRYHNSLRYRQQVVYHEYGHAVDHASNIRGKREFLRLFTEYQDTINFQQIHEELVYLGRAAQGGRSTHLLKKYGANNFHDLLEMVGGTADTIKALNVNYGWGHTTQYFRNINHQYGEFIAHAFENKYLGNPVFKSLLPELYDDMIKMLNTILK